MKLGISTFAYSWSIGIPGAALFPAQPLTALGFLKEARRLGLRLVQFGDNLPLHTLDEAQLTELRDFAFANGMDIQTGTRGLKDEIVERYLELAGFFSSGILRVVIDQEGYEPSISEIIAVLKRWEPPARSKNTVIAIENHDRFSCDTLIDIIKALDSPFVRICLDTVNSFGALEGPDLVVKKLAPFTVNVHIKDFTIYRPSHKLGFVVEGVPAGSGLLDLALLMENEGLKARTAVLELWTPPEDTIEYTMEKERRWVQESIDNLKKVSFEL